MSEELKAVYEPGYTGPRTIPNDVILYTGAVRYERGQHAAGVFYQWDMLLVIEGMAHWTTPVGEFETSPGDLLILRPGCGGKWVVPKSQSHWQAVWALFHPRPHWQEWLLDLMGPHMALHFPVEDESVYKRLVCGLQATHRLNVGGSFHRQEWALLALERALLTLHSYRTLQGEAADLRMQQAIRFMHQHYTRPLTIREIARSIHMSESHFSFVFRRQMGMTPMEYMEDMRLRRAKEMLRLHGMSINQIATALGYRNAAYFTRRFRLHTGQTPSAYRQNPKPA